MGFASLVQRITFKVSGRSTASSGLYTPSTEEYDYALGGVPFLSAAGDTRPDTEKPVQQRKQQFDNYKDPGEYSLNQWWLRSQTSFAGGAGVKYQDPDTQGTSLNIRYAKSVGVDPFTDSDNLQLLHEVNKSVNYTGSNVGPIRVVTYIDTSNTERLMIVSDDGSVVSGILQSGDIGTSFQRTGTIGVGAGSTNLVTYHARLAALGAEPKVFAFSDTTSPAGSRGLWRITDNGGGALITERIYIPPVATLTFPSDMIMAHGSIYIGSKEKLYALSPTAAVDTAFPAAVAQVPSDQIIRSIANGPDAIYVAANNDYAGYIYKSTFDSAGVVNGLTQVAVLPNGELINNISAYIATYLVISSMTGIRVATFTGSGISYGPQIVSVPIDPFPTFPGNVSNSSGFGPIVFYGTRAYITTQTGTSQHDGAQGVMAIDLSTIITDDTAGAQFNAYSTWVYSPLSTSKAVSIAVDAVGRLIYATAKPNSPTPPTIGEVWIQHTDNLISLGYLDTGRCRFNTVEPKLFKYFSLRTPSILQGDLTVALLDENGGLTNYITYGPTLDPGTSDVATPTPVGPHMWQALRFTLHRGASDATIGAKLDSWQVKALPGTLKQRMITRQFLCFNSEKDKTGQVIAGDTQALDKLTAIRQMCQRGDTVTFQDLVNNISDQVVIDDYQFTMMTPPGPNGENYGGYLTVMMRTVADSVPPVSLAGSVDPE